MWSVCCKLKLCWVRASWHTVMGTLSLTPPIYFSAMPVFLFKTETASLDQFCPFWALTKGWASFPLMHRSSLAGILVKEGYKENLWNRSSQTWTGLCKHLSKVLRFPFSLYRIETEIQPCKKAQTISHFWPMNRWVVSDSKFRFHSTRWFLNRFQF